MRNFYTSALYVLCLSLSLPGPAAPPASGFQVGGAVAKTADWQVSALREQFKSSLQSTTYTRRGVKHTAHAVPLWLVIQAASPRLNPQIKNHLLQFIVLVSGHDGYTAAFSLAELSPQFGNRQAWLALDEDGKPLGDTAAGEAGSADLIVPGDMKAGRWVHSVQRVVVVDEAQIGTIGRP